MLKENNKEKALGFVRKYLSADGLVQIVKHSLHREQFKVIQNSEYSWQDCIMSGLAVFGFKMPSFVERQLTFLVGYVSPNQFEKQTVILEKVA